MTSFHINNINLGREGFGLVPWNVTRLLRRVVTGGVSAGSRGGTSDWNGETGQSPAGGEAKKGHGGWVYLREVLSGQWMSVVEVEAGDDGG